MKARRLPYLILTVVILSSTTTISFGKVRSSVQHEHHDPIPQFMVQNFFNILIQGATAVTAENSEDQIKATANALNSISNLAQLVFKSSNMRLSDEEHDIIQQLSAKLYKACINNPLFMSGLETHREETATKLAAIMNAPEPLAHHSEHE